MLDLRPGPGSIGVHQKPNTTGQGTRHRNLGRVQQRHDIPSELLGRPGGECGIEVPGDRKERADDIVGLQLVGLYQGSQQLVGGGEDLVRIVSGDRGGSPNALQPDRGWHGA